jgi:putative addiction module component (TIGR02574 family)
MDLVSVLREVNAWPVEDRMKLVHEVWDHLVDQGFEPDLSEELKVELDRRIAADDAAPDDVVSWEHVKAEALERAGQ